MFTLPKAVGPVLSPFSIAFTQPTFQRMMILFVGSVLVVGRHTVAAALRVVGPPAPGHHTDYHRVFSRARWSLWLLGKVLCAMVPELVTEGEPAVCAVDDTTPQHKGKCVWGKDRHRDACRSTHSHTVRVFGHKRVVPAINIKFTFAARPWTSPVLVALYRTPEGNKKQGCRHKTRPSWPAG